MKQRNTRKNLEMRLVCSVAMAVAAFTFIYGGKRILTRIQTSNLSSGYSAYRNGDATHADRNLHSHAGNSTSVKVAPRICHSNIVADPGQFHEPLTVVFYMFGVFYLMIFINVVCEEYFVETVHKAVDILEIPESAAGATIMAAGSSMPELMAGLVGYTFKEAEDAGVGTVVGSLIFNSLFIVGASVWVSPIQKIGIDPFALLRDSIFYITSVLCALIAFSTGQASWVTSLCLMLLYILYVAVNMKWSSIEFQLRVKFPALGDAAPESVKAKSAQKQLSEFDDSGDIILDDEEAPGQGNYLSKGANPLSTASSNMESDKSTAGMSPIPSDVEENKVKSVGVIVNACTVCMGILVRPIKGLLYYTVPRFLKAGTLQTSRGNWWILAQMCVSLLWLSIAVFFMIEWAEKAGCLMGISSSLMGLTVLAIGTSTPDAMVC